MSIADLRREFTAGGLDITDLDPDPIRQFDRWFQQALDSQIMDANAMTLATATPSGIPSARIVLLKGVDNRGFTFYTSYEGAKAQELEQNPHAALVFYWHELDRQVRIVGIASRVSREESEQYFASRPRGSQLGAWASKQSQRVADRQQLEQAMREMEAKFPQQVPCPAWWGGYRVEPAVVEFWQGRPGRLHDRLVYTKQPNGHFAIERLSP